MSESKVYEKIAKAYCKGFSRKSILKAIVKYNYTMDWALTAYDYVVNELHSAAYRSGV